MKNKKDMNDMDTARGFLKYFSGNQIFAAMGDQNAVIAHYPREFDDCVEQLQKRNEDGSGVFFTVNELDVQLDRGRHRTQKMFVGARAFFLDDDVKREPGEGYRTDFALQPNIVVESSPGKYHYYWLLKDSSDMNPEEISRYKQLMKEFVVTCRADIGVKDITRVMRVPGFFHMKDADNPWMVTFEVLKEERYTVEQIINGFELSDGNVAAITTGGVKVGTANAAGKLRIGANLSTAVLSDSKSVDIRENEIINGLNLHENILKLAYQLNKEGVKSRYIVLTLQGLMNGCRGKIDEERWQARYSDIERTVCGGKEHITQESIDISAVAKDVCSRRIPAAPGLLGEFIKDSYEMSIYQYDELALVSVLGVLAGVCGRKFNVSGTGLNLYLTLIMDTGMGKEHITRFTGRAINEAEGLGLMLHADNESGFVGPARFTGPKSIYNSLKDSRSQICVFSEAGLLLKSKSGDQDGLTRMLLSYYNKSGKWDYSEKESYSSVDNSIMRLRSPALSIVNEATAETLLSVFRESGALENGGLPRQSLFRVTGNKPYPNQNVRREFRKECIERLSELTRECRELQTDSTEGEVIDVEYGSEVKEEIYLYQKSCVDLENQERGNNQIKQIMATRLFVKAIKFAALTAIFNWKSSDCRGSKGSRESKGSRGVCVGSDDWKFGKGLAEYEYHGIDNFFGGKDFSNILEVLAKNVVAPCIRKLLRDEYKSSNVRLSRVDINNQTFGWKNINQIMKNKRELQYSEKIDTPTAGLKNVLDYMVSSEYLKIIYGEIRTVSKKTNQYKLCRMFESLK